MTEGLIAALAFTVPGSIAAALALQAAANLSGQYVSLKVKAAEHNQAVPPLVAVYFRNTVRLLFITGLAFIALAATDAVLALLKVETPSRLLGYAGGLALLVCGFGLLLQGSVDRHLKLHPGRWRFIYVLAGAAGIAAAAWGMMIVTLNGRVWP